MVTFWNRLCNIQLTKQVILNSMIFSQNLTNIFSQINLYGKLLETLFGIDFLDKILYSKRDLFKAL